MLRRIVEIDLRKPLAPIAIDERYRSVLALVRIGPRPIGKLELERPDYGHVISVETLRAAIGEVLEWDVWSAAIGPDEPLPPQPPISVVVCTRDRPDSLKRCLDSLAKLDYPEFEVVVVDNASKNTRVAEVIAESGFRYVREDTPGLDWARNCGFAAASHAIIAYTDDDVRVDPYWLRGVARAFAEPGISAMSGLVMPGEVETVAQAFFERYGGMTKGFAPRTFHRDRLGDTGVIAAHNVGVGANMAFRRDALAQLEAFDTALDVGTPSFGGGDIDMFHRILASGMAIRYEPNALVWHYHRRDQPGLYKQIYSNGRAFGVYLQKIWQQRSASRQAVADYAVRWVGGWLLKRLAAQLRGTLDFPLDLVWAEIHGATSTFTAFRETYQQDAVLRRKRSGEAAD